MSDLPPSRRDERATTTRCKKSLTGRHVPDSSSGDPTRGTCYNCGKAIWREPPSCWWHSGQ